MIKQVKIDKKSTNRLHSSTKYSLYELLCTKTLEKSTIIC